MQKKNERAVIVGASAAGLRCAARLRRLQADRQITVVEKGEVFSLAACGMPYVLSGDIPQEGELLKTDDGTLRDLAYFSEAKGIEILSNTLALSVDVEHHLLKVKGPGGVHELPWDDLVLATGARPRRLPGQVQHPRVLSFHDLGDLRSLDEGLKKGKIRRVLIVGAGLVGCELAEAFKAMWDSEVCLLEAGPWPLAQVLDSQSGAVVAHEMKRNEVELHCDTFVKDILADDDGVVVRAQDCEYKGDVAIVAFGVQARVELAQSAGVRIGPSGAIAVDEHMSTSIPHIWAVGDCVEVSHVVSGAKLHMPMGSLANRQGRMLANILAGRRQVFGAVAGAIAIKVFDLNVGAVGLSLDKAKKIFPTAEAVWSAPHDRAHYWPESETILLQMVFDGESRRVLGIQALGKGECAKRIDVASQLILAGAGLEDFCNLEHAYAPPYAPAMEPLAQLAMIAENHLDGVCAKAPDSDLHGLKILDVRTGDERKEIDIPGGDTLAVEQMEIRSKLSQLPSEPFMVLCSRGTRSAEVCRLLRQHGRDACYLGGGVAWLLAMGLVQKN